MLGFKRIGINWDNYIRGIQMKKLLALFLMSIIVFNTNAQIFALSSESTGLKEDNYKITKLNDEVTEISVEVDGKVTSGYATDTYVTINGKKYEYNVSEEVTNDNISEEVTNYKNMKSYVTVPKWQKIRTYKKTAKQTCDGEDVFKIVILAILTKNFGVARVIAVGIGDKYCTEYYRKGKVEYEFDLDRTVYGKTSTPNYCKRVDKFYGNKFKKHITTKTYEGYGLF